MILSQYHYSPPFLGVQYYEYFLVSEISQINKAFLIAWMVHANSKPRMNGLPYITHPVEMVKATFDEFHVYDAELTITEILHDTNEPSVIPFFNQGIQMQFGVSVAENNQLLTKTDKNKLIYLEDIIRSGRWVPVLAKLIDRLHNMRTLEKSTLEFQIKQATETRNYFLTFCNELSKIIPQKYEAVPPKIFMELVKLCEKYGC